MDDRHERGGAAAARPGGVRRAVGAAGSPPRLGARFGRAAITAAAGAWVDDCLSLRDRSLAVVAALVAQGAVDDRLRGHVRWAVEHGSSREELEALVTLLAVYVGFPRASVAMEIVRDELSKLEAG